MKLLDDYCKRMHKPINSSESGQNLENYVWGKRRDNNYSLTLGTNLKSAILTIRNLPKGTTIRPFGLEHRIGEHWAGPLEETAIDAALDIEAWVHPTFPSIILARFLNGVFKYGSEYKPSRIIYCQPYQDFRELKEFTARLLEFLGISHEQLCAFFKDSNLPETYRCAVGELIQQDLA